MHGSDLKLSLFLTQQVLFLESANLLIFNQESSSAVTRERSLLRAMLQSVYKETVNCGDSNHVAGRYNR